MRYDTHMCWLPFLPTPPDAAAQDSVTLARSELALGLETLNAQFAVTLAPTQGEAEAYTIERGAEGPGYVIRGGRLGVLYGTYRLLLCAAAGRSPETAYTEPAHALRMINHWDNMSGVVERGYAGPSLFFRDGDFSYDPVRMRQYARMLASIGINTISVNNVNVHPPADALILPELLPKLSALAAVFRPFGIRLLVAVDFSLPTRCGLATADPLNADVQAWWRQHIDALYGAIPNLRGLIIKADSENRPGPYLYGCNHAQGARLFSAPLAAHGGVLVWRCFVYNCKQDWRDTTVDRPKASYENYAGLDGEFAENVILQIKYGPFDFQVREPNSPLFYAMPNTRKALELQLAQEYTGHQIDLYYMPPQWEEILEDLGGNKTSHICAVSNLGSDENWTGNDLAQANLFAYGLLAWWGKAAPQETAAWWIALTFGQDARVCSTLQHMLLASRGVYEQYTAPLGLCWMVSTHLHYGPSPEGYEYTPWGTYLHATRDAVGIDRTPSGTGYTSQYPPVLAAQYESLQTCPERLLLFFHRLPYTYVLRDGRTLIQRIYDDHFEGAAQAASFVTAWESLRGSVPARAFDTVYKRFQLQAANAREWCDVINSYFCRYSGIEDVHGRKIYYPKSVKILSEN